MVKFGLRLQRPRRAVVGAGFLKTWDLWIPKNQRASRDNSNPNAAMSMRDADEHHTVYRQDSILTIRDVERKLEQKHTREHIKAGGLFCSHGSEMTFVICSKRTNHFRHLVTAGFRNKSKDEDFPGNGLVPGTSCGCSSRHLDAQALLRDHDYSRQPVVFTEWRDCLRPECCRTVYKAEGMPSVRLEVREKNGKFVSDVVYYREDDGKPCMRVEVLASHKADRDRRAGTEFVEVEAKHVSESFKEAECASSVTLRCEGSCTGHHEVCHPCVERKRIAREQAEAAREQAEAAREQAEARRREEQQREAERWRMTEEARVRRSKAAEEVQRRGAVEAWRRFEEQRQEKARLQNERRREAECEAERVRLAEEARYKEEVRVRIAELDARRAAHEAALACPTSMEVVYTPNFSVSLGTDAPEVSQEEIESLRAARLARQAEAAKAKRRRGPTPSRKR